jgi:hypothetical protein
MKYAGVIMAAVLAACGAAAQAQPDSAPRVSLSAGMGVAYASYADVTTLINATMTPSQVVPQFKTAVEFFGACTFPLLAPWLLKFEYAYTLATFSPMGPFGPTTFNVTYHMPSVILQYVLIDRGVYNVKAGAGGGYHFGILEEKSTYFNSTYSAKGPGFVLEMEANTAFGDHLFAYLGANVRWDAVGRVTDSSGASPGIGSSGSGITLHSFGAGGRLGASYLF